MNPEENLKPKKKRRSKSSNVTTKDAETNVEKRKTKSHKEKLNKSAKLDGTAIKNDTKIEHLENHVTKNDEERPKTMKSHKEQSKNDIFKTAFDDTDNIEANFAKILDALNNNDSNVKVDNLKILFENLIKLPNKFNENRVPESASKLSGEIVEHLHRQSSHDQFDWTPLWLEYFRTGNPYFLELLIGIHSEQDILKSDQNKSIFLNDLYNFLITVKDSRNAPFTMTAEDEENFGRLIEDPVKSCFSKITNINATNQFTELINDLLKLCLETGPGNTAHFYRSIKVNVFDSVSAIVLKILFDDQQNAFNLNIIRQNMKLLVNIFVLNNKHKCTAERQAPCRCYEDPKMDLYAMVESYVFTKSPKLAPADVVLYVTDVIRKYQSLAPYQWLDFVRALYPQAKNETEKSFDVYFSVLKSTDSNYEQKLQSVLNLLQNIAQKNPYVFNVDKISVLENACLFNDGCSPAVKNLTLHILYEISQRNCDPFFKNKGQTYYQIADSINIDSMMTVNNLLKNVGLCNPQECERVVGLMEKEIVKNEDNKTFVQHVLITWKDMVMENANPFKKRRAFVKRFVDDPKLSRNAKDILALSEPDSKTCVIV